MEPACVTRPRRGLPSDRNGDGAAGCRAGGGTRAAARARLRPGAHREPGRMVHRRTRAFPGTRQRANRSGREAHMSTDREHEITRAFVSIANSMAEGADVVDLLSRLTSDCARLLDIASAGLLLADSRGALHVLAASSERTRDLEIFQLQSDEGPCLDCFHSGQQVSVNDLSLETKRWPQFVAAATAAGFAAVHALPMRLRGTTLGALNLFGDKARVERGAPSCGVQVCWS